jgi:serine/threonine-protein kinase HipA
MLQKCFYCYQALAVTEHNFHPNCAIKMFGNSTAPILDFNLKQLEELAKQIVTKSIAVTGVQPKLSLELVKSKNELSRLTIVGLHGNYILKPPSIQYKEMPQNEDVTMHLASLAKIKTAQHCLIRLASGELAYLTKRFDRTKKEKIAMEDFCQLTENSTEHKYRSSIEKVAKTTYQYSINKGFEMLRLFELVLFCYLIGNSDMHLKNFALLENNLGEFELSPAYDLLSSELIVENDNEESALTINGRKNKLKRKDFDVLALNMQINTKVLESIYYKFEYIVPTWISFIKQSFLSKSMQKNYIELIERKHKIIF